MKPAVISIVFPIGDEPAVAGDVNPVIPEGGVYHALGALALTDLRRAASGVDTFASTDMARRWNRVSCFGRRNQPVADLYPLGTGLVLKPDGLFAPTRSITLSIHLWSVYKPRYSR